MAHSSETEIEMMRREVRQLTQAFDDLSLQIRVDTPWVRIKSHMRYAIHILKEIPVFSRLLIFIAIVMNTVPFFIKIPDDMVKKMRLLGLDLIVTALVFI